MPKHTKSTRKTGRAVKSVVNPIRSVKPVAGSFITARMKVGKPLKSQASNIMTARKTASTSSKARKAKKNAI